MGKQQQNDILSRIDEQIEFYEGRMQMLYVFFFEDVKKEIERFQARVKELEAINLGLTKTLVEMEAENAELREAVARCRYQASFIIGSPESLRERMRKIREIANEALADDEGEA